MHIELGLVFYKTLIDILLYLQCVFNKSDVVEQNGNIRLLWNSFLSVINVVFPYSCNLLILKVFVALIENFISPFMSVSSTILLTKESKFVNHSITKDLTIAICTFCLIYYDLLTCRIGAQIMVANIEELCFGELISKHGPIICILIWFILF